MTTAPSDPDHVERLALTVEQAARAIGVSPRKFRELLLNKDAGIPVVRLGRRLVVPKNALQEWLANSVGKQVG